ncbi:MAG TPA: hypothetical protein EYQ24_10425 [Bacteroidetes bacterium]|nr:hypothetical protein [Bacteroidota bacterium]
MSGRGLYAGSASGAVAPERPILQRLFGPIRVGLYQAWLNGAWVEADVTFGQPVRRMVNGRLQLSEAEYLVRLDHGMARSVLDGTRVFVGEVDDLALRFWTPEGGWEPC